MRISAHAASMLHERTWPPFHQDSVDAFIRHYSTKPCAAAVAAAVVAHSAFRAQNNSHWTTPATLALLVLRQLHSLWKQFDMFKKS